MKPYSEYLNYIMECMASIRDLRVCGMFGGYGLYQNDLIFAIVVNDVLLSEIGCSYQARIQQSGLAAFHLHRGGQVGDYAIFCNASGYI